MIGLSSENLIESATLSGGDWLVALPITNAATRTYAQVARSTDDDPLNTQFEVDHGSAKSARVLALVATNLTSTAQIKWSRGTTPGGSDVYAGSFADAWQFSPRAYNGKRHAMFVILPQAYSARYDLIEIDDISSTGDGYVEIGYAWIGALSEFQAEIGLQDPIRDLGSKDRSSSGALWTNQQRTLREAVFGFPYLSVSEAETLHELMRYCGTTEPILYTPDPTSAADTQRYGFVGSLDELSPIERRYYLARSVSGIRITES